jgi:hypothetical protein
VDRSVPAGGQPSSRFDYPEALQSLISLINSALLATGARTEPQ